MKFTKATICITIIHDLLLSSMGTLAKQIAHLEPLLESAPVSLLPRELPSA